MKQIGWTGAGPTPTKWGPDFPSGPMALFIPEPGEREQIDAEHYRHVGWVVPDHSKTLNGGLIYDSHHHAGPDSRPAYVRQVRHLIDEVAAAPLADSVQYDGGVVRQSVPIEHSYTDKPTSDSDNMTAIIQLNKRLDDLESGTQPLMPGEEQQNDTSDAIEKLGLKRSMGVLFARLELHSTRLENLEEICRPDLVAHGVLSPGAAAKLAMSKEYGEIGRSLPSTIPTSELLSEATEFCNEELDRFDGLDFDSDAEVGCQRSATYIRELVRRLSEYHEALRPFTAAGTGGRGSALPDSDPLAIISANMPDLPQWIAKARGIVTMGDVRRAMEFFKDEKP